MQGVKDLHGSSRIFQSTGYVGHAHRDLKPANVIVAEGENLKLIDFGLAAPIVDDDCGSPIKLSGMCGSKAYMAPEVIQWERETTYDAVKVDMFACGVILYNMVSGKYPFRAAKSTDESYKQIMRGDWTSFWQGKS
jgi:serine/threonine protein kinase